MNQKKNNGSLGASSTDVSSNNYKNVSFAPGDYYARPEVKGAILEFSEYKKDNLVFSKAAVHDNTGWYSYKGKRPNQKRKMYQGNNSNALSHLIYSTKRTVYLTLNYFREDYKPFREFQDRTWNIGGWENCYGYMLSVDIDIKEPFSIHDEQAKKALQVATEFTYTKLSELSKGKCICLFSGNGTYIHLNPGFGYLRADIPNKKRVSSYESLIKAFNSFIFDIETLFYKEYPQYKDYVKLDKINNRNRQIKAPLSIHKNFDYVVYPIPADTFAFPLIRYQDITVENITGVREQLKEFLNDEPSFGELEQFKKTLKDYFAEAKKEIKDNKYRRGETTAPREAYDIDIITLEPVVEAIFDRNEWEEGNIRRITLMASYMAASGWKLAKVRSTLLIMYLNG